MKAKYKGKGGVNQFRFKRDVKRNERKQMKFENRLQHGKIKLPKINLGYIFTYKGEMTDRIWTFADLHQIKLVNTLSIWSPINNKYAIDQILKNRKNWAYNNEIAYIPYEFVSVKQCKDKRENDIRKTDFFDLGYKEDTLEKSFLSSTGEKKIVVYTCYTNLNYLKYLSKKYDVKGWKFTINHKIHLVTDKYIARKIEQTRAKMGGTVDYFYDSKLVPKPRTKKKKIRIPVKPHYTFDNDPIKQKMVCITDGITVHRVKQYKADRVVARFPKKIRFCNKVFYQEYLNKLSGFDIPKDKKPPKLTTQGSKNNPKDTRPRRERSHRKEKKYSRYYTEQKVTGRWVPGKDGYENFIEDGSVKTLHHHIRPSTNDIKIGYNPKNRKQFKPMFEKIEKDVQGIVISKFPYNKPITILYKVVDKDGIEHGNAIKQNVKMLNKKLLYEDPDIKETVVVCSVKDVEKWCYQEDYKEIDSKEETSWIPYVKIETTKRITNRRIPFHLPHREKKQKQWKCPMNGDRTISPRIVTIKRHRLNEPILREDGSVKMRSRRNPL